MSKLAIIRRLITSGAFNYEGYRYFTDFDGWNWIVRRAPLHPGNWYSASESEYFAHYTL